MEYNSFCEYILKRFRKIWNEFKILNENIDSDTYEELKEGFNEFI